MFNEQMITTVVLSKLSAKDCSHGKTGVRAVYLVAVAEDLDTGNLLDLRTTIWHAIQTTARVNYANCSINRKHS